MDREHRELSSKDKMLTKRNVERHLKQLKISLENTKKLVSFYEEVLITWPDDKDIGHGFTAIQVLTPTSVEQNLQGYKTIFDEMEKNNESYERIQGTVSTPRS